MSSSYPKLLSSLPLNSGLVSLKNRVLMGSMHSGLEAGSVTGGFVDLTSMGKFFARRASGGVGLIVTGGVAPNRAGWVAPFSAKLSNADEMRSHKVVTEMVGEADEDCKIAMQILHSGRYGYHPLSVAPSAVKSPIGWFTPKALSGSEVDQTIEDYVNTSLLAQEAGYHGVEVSMCVEWVWCLAFVVWNFGGVGSLHFCVILGTDRGVISARVGYFSIACAGRGPTTTSGFPNPKNVPSHPLAPIHTTLR